MSRKTAIKRSADIPVRRVVSNRDAARPAGKSTAELVRQANRWRDGYNALRGLVISKVVSLIEAADRGDYAELQLVLKRIERRFPVMKALKARRLAALEKLDWEIKVMDPLPPGLTAAQAEAQRDFLRSRYDLLENLTDAFGQLVLAEFRGFTILQKHRYQDGPNDGAVCELHWLPQWTWSRTGEFGHWYYNQDSQFGVGGESCAASLGEKNRIGSDEMPREDFVIREHDTPLYEIALIAFINWSMGRKDNAAFVEIFGLPNAIVILPPSVPTGKEAEYLSAAEKVADGVSGALPNGSDAKFPTASVRSNAPFKEFCDANVEDVVLAGTGGLLTMLSRPTGIGQGASGEHGDAFDDIAEADARRINETLQRDFDRLEIAAKFPAQPVAVYFELCSQDEEDAKATVENYGVAVRAGVITPNRDDESHFREKLALPPMSKDVEREWKSVGGTRAPITVQQEGLPVTPAFGPRTSPSAAMPPATAGQGNKGQGNEDDDEAIRNRAAILNSQSSILASAVARDLSPVLAALDERLARIVEITDPALRKQKFDEAWAELEPLLADIQADPATAKALEQITAPALARGLTESAIRNRQSAIR
jgi:phage gp29-like protein